MRHFFLILLSLTSFQLLGQLAARDTMFLSEARKKTVRIYTNTFSAHADVFNGREYREYRQAENEHPYLFLDWSEGSIEYNGKLFEDVPLLYDLSSDEIITEHSSGAKIALIKNRVTFFLIKGHRYEFLSERGIANGFYDILYKGKATVVARREKSRQEKMSGTTFQVVFEEKVRYYLLQESRVIGISSRRSLIRELSQGNSEIKKRLNTVGKGTNKEDALVAVTEAFQQLSSVK